MAFWNRWTLGLDFGPGKRWTLDRYFDPKTQKNISLLCVFGPIFPEISVQSPAFPGPKHKSRVQRFQNACINRVGPNIAFIKCYITVRRTVNVNVTHLDQNDLPRILLKFSTILSWMWETSQLSILCALIPKHTQNSAIHTPIIFHFFLVFDPIVLPKTGIKNFSLCMALFFVQKDFYCIFINFGCFTLL